MTTVKVLPQLVRLARVFRSVQHKHTRADKYEKGCNNKIRRPLETSLCDHKKGSCERTHRSSNGLMVFAFILRRASSGLALNFEQVSSFKSHSLTHPLATCDSVAVFLSRWLLRNASIRRRKWPRRA